MNPFKLFRRKKDDKEIIVDEKGEEVTIEEEAPKVEETKDEPIETNPIDEEIKEDEQPVEVATEVDSKEPIPENIEVQESEEVKTLKLELETIKAELEALKKAQVVEPEPEKEEDKTYEEFGLSYDAHFTDGSESNKKPRF